MVRCLGILSAIAGWGCFGPSLPALECGDGNICPEGLVCKMPERICSRPTADASPDGPAFADAPPADAAAPAQLIDRGLLARYLINEAASGTAPPELLDSAPQPLHLPIAYAAVLEYAEVDGHRGLRWSKVRDDGGATTQVAMTKLTALDGTSEATYELVVEVNELRDDFSHMIHLGQVSDLGDASFGGNMAGELVVNYFAGGQTRWPVSILDERHVIHLVFDATALSAERLKLYIDGAEVGEATGAPLPGPLLLENNAVFTVGNRPPGNRSIRGVIYYAAVYQAALDETEIASNAARLALDDDTP